MGIGDHAVAIHAHAGKDRGGGGDGGCDAAGHSFARVRKVQTRIGVEVGIVGGQGQSGAVAVVDPDRIQSIGLGIADLDLELFGLDGGFGGADGSGTGLQIVLAILAGFVLGLGYLHAQYRDERGGQDSSQGHFSAHDDLLGG
jgi:hypothetical protein